jgi:membrane protein DedA with SNARE-associated domain
MDDKLSSRRPRPGPPPDLLGEGAERRKRIICLSVILAYGIYSIVGLAAIPSLIASDPVLLELLRGSTAAMVAGGAFARVGRASLVLAILAPFPTLMLADPFVWWAGKLWGPAAIELIAGQGAQNRRGTRRAMRVVERSRSWGIVFGYILPIPTAIIYAAAGWTGMPLWQFLVLDLIGTAIWVGLIVGLGWGLGHAAVHVAHEISHYGLIVTITIVVVAVVLGVWRGSRLPPDPLDAPEPPEPGP